ncbi:MAG: hypothetical protein WCG42_09725 [Parachlamydiaceae bacterium]
MFAGPNGSGKSTVKASINPELLGLYINPDKLEVKTDAIPAWFKKAVWDKFITAKTNA